MAVAAASVSLLALMGYAYATEALQGLARFTPIALNTSITFLILSLGVLFSLRRRGLMAVLSSEGPAGEMARHLLPPVFVFPFALGWIRLQGQRKGFFGTEFGVALLVTSTIAILAVVVWRATLMLNRADAARKRAEEALERRSEELARSNEELERFAYVASHDLQEPLRMVSSYVQLIERRYKGRLDSDADEFIGYAVEGAGRMQRLITDLLAFSRVGRPGKEFESTSLDTALDRALSNLRMAIEESGAAVTHDSLPVVGADPTQMAQVFQNLVGNAIKFRGKEPPRVHVSVRWRTGEWLFAVRDNGIGVEADYLERIFIVFQRLHGSRYPGTGIGLPISRKIVERHGGRMWVESEPGKGLTFFFTLPRLPDRDREEAPKAAATRS
jgi:signal transduction histidine kinase